MKQQFCLFVALLLLGCKNDAAAPAPAASQVPAASAAASVAAPQLPWYQGSWTGTYAAERLVIELPIGAVRDWSKDDGSRASGAGELKLTVTADGLVSGSATGPLGKHAVRGSVLQDSLRLEFLPEEATPDAFRGTGLTERAGDTLKGELKASSGDSLTVRKASLTLTKQPGG